MKAQISKPINAVILKALTLSLTPYGLKLCIAEHWMISDEVVLIFWENKLL